MSSPRRSHQDGIALIVVLLLGLISLALMTALITFGAASTPVSRQSQDWNGALSAAEAGLDDYIHKLSVDGNYFTYGASPPEPNSALGVVGGPVTFKGIPGVDPNGEFHYEVTEQPTPSRPTVRVKVTGKVRGEERSIEATLRRSSFLDYIYSTDYETKDPLSYETAVDGAGHDTTWAGANCANRFRYPVTGADPRPQRANDCTEIRFITGDIIRGPLHSNDSILIQGNPTFEEAVSTNWAAGPPNRLFDRRAGYHLGPELPGRHPGPQAVTPVASLE